ncbi:hypothetical protein D3C71_1718320 [compost metagenome]
MVTFNPGVAVFVTGDDAPAHIAGFRQRRLQIHHVTLFVPAAVGGGDVAFELFAVGVFTHHVDVGRGVTRSAHQAGCAAHHFDFVENGRVACGITKIPAVIEESGHIFIGKVAYEETARIEVGTAGIDA